MKKIINTAIVITVMASLLELQAQDVRIEVQAGQGTHPVSRYLTGACIEDVNHEVYGGIDSQMIFGESFAETVPPPAIQGFVVYGGRWIPREGVLQAAGGDGPKLVCDMPAFADGEAGVEVMFPDNKAGNAGLLVKVSQPGMGADRFTGYEVALETSGRLVLGRHRQNWEPIRTVPCSVPLNQWIPLSVRMAGKSLEILVDGKVITQYEDNEHPLEKGTVALRTWQREALFRNLVVSTEGETRKTGFVIPAASAWGDGVSGMWRALRRGDASGNFHIEEKEAFSGRQSQRMTLSEGKGEIGIENQGLNRWGMNFIQGRPFEGYVCVRASQPMEFFVALESKDGSKVYGEKKLKTSGGEWQKVSFSLKPNESDSKGRFAIKLKSPGSISVGYAFLQPGDWGRYKGLPVRKDVAEGLIGQGITVLRLGGCMANATEYRWKKMIGPREKRPPYSGWWYPHSSNGWGIFDFLNFCEAAGFLSIPDVNMGESPEDMADFIEYVNGPANSTWGRRRAADGHPAPYRLKYLQLGNEERVDEKYAARFELLARAIWAKDKDIILVVGDFAYGQPITDPFNVKGSAARITSLAGQQKILQLARQNNREVWFDVHVGTEGPRPDSSLAGMFSFRDALARLADGARHKVVVFEFNAGNHSQRRAVANALAINAIERDGGIPIATSANCLQPDGQNDNDWDQGLLFLNPSQAWLQPPGYVTQMYSRNYQPQAVACRVVGSGETLDVSAQRSENGRVLVIKAVNPKGESVAAQIQLTGFVPRKPVVQVWELSGQMAARNTAAQTNSIVTQHREWKHAVANGGLNYSFPSNSITVLRLE